MIGVKDLDFILYNYGYKQLGNRCFKYEVTGRRIARKKIIPKRLYSHYLKVYENLFI